MSFEGFRITVQFIKGSFSLSLFDDTTTLEEYHWVGTIPINDDLHNSLTRLLMIAINQKMVNFNNFP